MWDKVKQSIYKNLNLQANTIFAKKWGSKDPILLDQLLDALYRTNSTPKAMNLLGRSEKTFITNIKKLFPEVTLNGGGESWLWWFISKSDYKVCNKCSNIKLNEEFHIGQSKCKSCISAKNKNSYLENIEYHKNYWKIHGKEKSARYRARLLEAIPPWADLDKIKQIYARCPEGHHVDHIIPLKGVNVCGLHVESNLQYLTAEENLKKSNKFTG